MLPPDSNGIRRYEETDLVDTTFSGFLNKIIVDISAAITALKQDTGWITPTLGTGWTAEANNPPRYRKYRGVVFYKGRASAALGADAVAFTSQAGCHPDVVAGTFLSYRVDPSSGFGDRNSFGVRDTGAVEAFGPTLGALLSFAGIGPHIGV
jgi:hypothetical protein